MPDTALALAGVSKHYGDITAVDDVSLELARGEFLTMLGPSGSGKTTTLRMVAGFVSADAGKIELAGADVSKVPPHKRNIGVVFQNYALFPHMSALRNVAFPLESRGVSKKEAGRRAEEALELVGLHERVGRRPAEMSGGQQQRVAVARAIVFEPDLLLMDEPLGALDRKLRASMQIELMRIARETSATVISVTHDQEEALVMSDRIAIYNAGRIDQLGSAQDLYDRPRSVFVADFIGDSNIFHGRFDRGEVSGPGWCASAAGCELADGPAAIVLRPEHLTVSAADGSAAGEVNCRTGTVSECIYLGSEWKYVIALSGGETAQARLNRGEVDEPIAPGTEVEICWRPDRAVVLPDEDAGSESTAAEEVAA
jgi:putative spermidine/putrescine transport system ATP-binding protein